MKIIYILRSFALIAGTERVEADKMNWLAEHGFDVTLITYEQGEHPLAFPLHKSIRHIDISTCFYMLGNYSLPKRLYKTCMLRRKFKRELRQFIESIQPNIIVVTTYSMKLIGAVLSVKGSAKAIVESHQACYTVKKTFDHGHNPLITILATVYDTLILRQIRKSDLVVTLTQSDANDWKRYAGNVSVIPNPVTVYPDTVRLHDGRGKRIISVGRLEEQKGFDLLIDAFSMFVDKCPGWKLDIFGKGSEEMELRKRIKDRNLEWSVRINAPTRNIYEEYQNSDFYVLSSRYEGFGLVLVEAMSCGIPCVAYDCNYGPSDIIEDGETGILVQNGNVRELAEKMVWMATHIYARLNMGTEARKRIAYYKKDNIMQMWLSVFMSMTDCI